MIIFLFDKLFSYGSAAELHGEFSSVGPQGFEACKQIAGKLIEWKSFRIAYYCCLIYFLLFGTSLS